MEMCCEIITVNGRNAAMDSGRTEPVLKEHPLHVRMFNNVQMFNNVRMFNNVLPDITDRHPLTVSNTHDSGLPRELRVTAAPVDPRIAVVPPEVAAGDVDRCTEISRLSRASQGSTC